ncbi:MAG: SDR family oxidoreductase [Woeseiaceae bacterium]
MLQNLDFKGKTALIMGASRGIGLATGQTLASYGAEVVLAGRNNQTIGARAESMRTQGYLAHAVECDVSIYSSVKSAVDQAVGVTGRIDILVNNAGVIEPLAHLVDSDPELWGYAADVNYKGVYHGMRAAIPLMLGQGGGIVVNMSSGAANSALPGWSHYCSNKAAAKKLTEVAHNELSGSGIRIVGLSPGTVATAFMEKIRDARINVVSNLDWDTHIPPDWAAEAVAFLCGPDGGEFAGKDFSIKTRDGRARVGLPDDSAPEKRNSQ